MVYFATACRQLSPADFLLASQTSREINVALYRTSCVVTSRAGSEVIAPSICAALLPPSHWPGQSCDHVNAVNLPPYLQNRSPPSSQKGQTGTTQW